MMPTTKSSQIAQDESVASPGQDEIDTQNTQAAPESEDRYDGHGRYDRQDYNDRQNGWQANGRADNRDDDRYNNDWQDGGWRETAQAVDDHPWRPNDDWRNEQRNGSERDRDRGTFGNSRFCDDDYGYGTSNGESRDYGQSDNAAGSDGDKQARQPRGYTAESERDYTDRNPAQERDA
ncbi:hypothetical protein [Asticcacaulis sp. AC466]|uniref:hypothetical protein n=1 Tax=Asticcacaulis sp. AC466 TaxID=1282362 RepID=UPI00138AFD5B|nr:hypothetical protein [Asticcacaulis sp. AC466]